MAESAVVEEVYQKACSICGKHVVDLGEVAGYRRGSVFRVYECVGCGVSSAAPMRSDIRIYDSIYANVSEVPGYSRYFHLANVVAKRRNPLEYLQEAEECYHGVIRTLLTESALKSVVEIGCGQGYLTYSMVRHGINATGVDISQEAVKLATRRYGAHFFCGTLSDFLEQGGVPPSHVVCTELIEHLENPVSFVQEIVAALAPGGKLIVTTPNKISSHEGVWNTELPPVHLWWFSRESLMALAAKAGVSASFFDFTEFHREHDLKDSGPAKPSPRAPILDEDYALVRRVPPRRLQPVVDAAKALLPVAAIRAARKLGKRGGGGPILPDSRAQTLCIIFEKA